MSPTDRTLTDPSAFEPEESTMASPAFAQAISGLRRERLQAPHARDRARVRPKLGAFGESLASSVGRSVGGEVFAHVAQHARRTVNRPTIRGSRSGPTREATRSTATSKIAVSRNCVPLPLRDRPRARRQAAVGGDVEEECAQVGPVPAPGEAPGVVQERARRGAGRLPCPSSRSRARRAGRRADPDP